MYEPRTYRHWVQEQNLISFNVIIKETDLYIRASSNLRNETFQLVGKYREQIERYMHKYPLFATSLEPITIDKDSPQIVKEMADASANFNVGPMATIAGAIAQFVGNELLAYSPEIIIENGGDIFLKSQKDRIIGIYAGKSPLSERFGLEIPGEGTSMGICTSSGTVGHSLSFGKADAAVVVAESALLADAAATAIGNIVSSVNDINNGLDYARDSKILKGVVIIKDDKMGIWGNIKICEIPR
ncbi:MAG: UPF0280 family protein [Dehalococcoidales bacterium]|nr:UPF0280 family protein [Dehalococcoidales bacterium]